MIKAVIFDIDNTLYSYDENHIYGMEALAVYCRDSFGITTDKMQACYRKAGRIMTDRIGTDTCSGIGRARWDWYPSSSGPAT